MELYVADKFLAEIDEIQEKYKTDKDTEKFANRLLGSALKYRKHFGTGDYLINLAEEEYFAKGDYLAGLTIIKVVHKHFKNIADDMTIYLRMAEYYIEEGETEKGIDFEAEDKKYYNETETELLEKLAVYIKENKKRFR